MGTPKIVIPKISKPCLGNASLWIFSNAIFGLAPLLFLIVINPSLDQNQAASEIDKLIKGGIVLFVCASLMGAVVIDILIEGLKFRHFAFFTINVSPFILLITICFLYLLIILGHVSTSVFTSFSKFYLFVIFFTIFYCTLSKYFLYQNKIEKEKVT